jgi:Rab-GTPase-TBC domain
MTPACESFRMWLALCLFLYMQELMESIVQSQSDELQMHFEKCGVVRSMFLPAWIMTVFSADFHPSVTGRLLDVMLVVGWRPPLKAAATALIQVTGDWLLKAQKMEIIVDIIKVCLAPAWNLQGASATTESKRSHTLAGAASSTAVNNSALNSHVVPGAVPRNGIS